MTPKDRLKNHCSPGNIIEHKGEFILCLTSYPMPLPYEIRSFADENAQLYTIRTADFLTFASPEAIHAKGFFPSPISDA